jgi:hypothetical protein
MGLLYVFFEGQMKRFKSMYKGTRGISSQIAKAFLLQNDICANQKVSNSELLKNTFYYTRKLYHTSSCRKEWSFIKINEQFGAVIDICFDEKRAIVQLHQSNSILEANSLENLPSSFVSYVHKCFSVVSPTDSFITIPVDSITHRCFCMLPYVSVIPNTFEHSYLLLSLSFLCNNQ